MGTLACALLAGTGYAGTITLRSDVLSGTPYTVGLNMGHYYPGTNAADYWDYIGASGTRLFISAGEIEPTDDIPTTGNGVAGPGDGVTDLASFMIRRAAMDNNAENTAYINWPQIIPKYSAMQTGTNRLRFNDVLTSLRSRGSSVLVNITASPTTLPISGDTDWPGKWELWQHFYFQAYYLAKNHGVYRFSMYNEPNHTAAAGLTPADWQMRLELASDAIRRAVAQVNRLPAAEKPYLQVPNGVPPPPSPLPVIVFAPNTASALGDLKVPAPAGAKLGDPGISQQLDENGQPVFIDGLPVLLITRNAWTDWGAFAIANRHRTFASGVPDNNWKNFDYYNYQEYGHTGSEQGSTLDDIRDRVAAAMPNEPAFKVAITEVNSATAADFDDSTATMDTPRRYAQLGSILTNLGKNFIREVYVFKMAQTVYPGNYPFAKNGLAYTDNDSSSPSKFQYGGLSLGGEVARLYFKASQPGRERLGFNRGAGLANLDIQVTRDTDAKRVWVYLVNFDQAVVDGVPNPNATKTIVLDTTPLAVPHDNRVIIESVSPGFAGGVVKYTRVNNNQVVCGDLPPESVWLVSIPTAAQQVTANGSPTLSVAASADSTVRDGTYNSTNFGTNTILQVQNDSVSTSGRHAAFLKFNISNSVKLEDIEHAILSVNGSTLSQSGVAQAFVYGCTDDAWTETGVTWSTAPGLAQNRAAGNRIRNAVATGQGSTLRLLGQITVDGPVTQERQIDVTDFVRTQTDRVASFLIVQDPRRDATVRSDANATLGSMDIGDAQVDGLKFISREGATPTLDGPTLKIVRRKASQ